MGSPRHSTHTRQSINMQQAPLCIPSNMIGGPRLGNEHKEIKMHTTNTNEQQNSSITRTSNIKGKQKFQTRGNTAWNRQALHLHVCPPHQESIYVLSWSKDVIDLASFGSEFHTWAASNRNDLLPQVVVLGLGTSAVFTYLKLYALFQLKQNC